MRKLVIEKAAVKHNLSVIKEKAAGAAIYGVVLLHVISPGGLASGIGSLLYDLTDPRFVSDCWITFLTKGAMGLTTGLVVSGSLKEDRLTYGRALVGTAVGCVAYYILYFAKTFFYTGLLKQGLPAPGAWLLVIEKVPASVFNAAVALIAAPPITLIILQALKRSHLDRLLEE